MCVPVRRETARRYADLHSLLPADLTTWSNDALDDLIEEIEADKTDHWERVMMLLAHHQSQHASQLLDEIRDQSPPDLDEFAELAYAESLGWLGFDYIRERGWEEPRVTPARGTTVNMA